MFTVRINDTRYGSITCACFGSLGEVDRFVDNLPAYVEVIEVVS